MSDNITKRTKSTLEEYKDFFKEYKTEIGSTALVLLAMHHFGLRKDFRKLAKTTRGLAELGAKSADLSAEVAENVERLNGDVDEVFRRLDLLKDWLNEVGQITNVQADRIEELEKTKQDLFTQFFGDRKKD